MTPRQVTVLELVVALLLALAVGAALLALDALR